MIKITRKSALISAAVVATLLLLGMTLLPALMKERLTGEIGRAMGRKCTLRSLSFNPLTLTVSAEGFALEERKVAVPFFAIGSVRASLSPASLFRRALIVSKLEIGSPTISVDRSAPHRYSFSDILEQLQSGRKPARKGDFRFSINNISVRNGSIDFNDLAVGGGRLHNIRKLEIDIPFISNIPYLAERYTRPRIAALVNGAPFSFAGKSKPLSKSMESSIHISLQRFKLPGLLAYYPQKPRGRFTSGALTLETDISYRVFSDRNPELTIGGLCRLEDIDARLDSGQPLFKLPLLEVRPSGLELFARRFLLESVRIDGFELYASRNGRGRWMYADLFPPRRDEPKAKADGRDTGKAPPPTIRVASLQFTNGAFHLHDAVPRGGFRGSVSHISLSLNNLSNASGQTGDYSLSLLLDGEASLRSKGSFSLAPLTLKSSTQLAGFRVQKGWPYLARYLTTPLKGVADLSADARYAPATGMELDHARLALRNLSGSYGKGEGFDLALLSIGDVSYNQKGNRLEVGEVKLSRGAISLSREADGALSPLALVRPAPPSVPSGRPPRSTPPRSKPAASSPFSYRIGQLRSERLNLAFTDRSREGEPRFTLRNTALALDGLDGPRPTPFRLRVSTTINKNGSFRADGQLTPLPFRYRGNVRITRLALTDFEEYFPDDLNVSLLGGALDGNLKLDVGLKNGKPEGTFGGNAALRSFHGIDAVSEEDLLKWESLQVDQFQGRLEPFSLAIRQIALSGVYSRIAVFKDGTLNLQHLVEQPPSPAPPAGAAPAATAPAVVAAPPPAPQQPAATAKRQISIGAITIQGGTLAFSDHHLPQQFATTFYNLGGRVSGMSSEETRFADVDLRGNLENHSPLRITGTINPLRDDLFVDLKVSFNDIELSPATPYTGTYLGYAVERGKLYLDLKYHIERKELRSENRIFIDQFTFGQRVESKQATGLPVKLALALLKDRRGEIHLDVPVAGRTDQPEFSVWRLVFQVVKNLLVKAATSPLSLLSSLFGGGTDLSTIQFGYGSETLPPAERQKLDALARALHDRPALKVELKGYVDREKDAEGYRVELLERRIRSEQRLSRARERGTDADRAAETATIGPEEYSRLLKAVYRKEKFAKPRTFLRLVKELPDAEMKKLIIANTVVTPDDLRTLARERSVAVQNYLVGKGEVAAERIFLKQDDVTRNPRKEGESGSRVELNAISP